MKNYSIPLRGTNNFIKNRKGFSILEVVSAIFIFSVVTVTIYGSFSAGLKSVAQSKHRIAATELANEKMEIIRNMPYGSIGTASGVPAGILPQNETVWKSNQKFNVHTYIRYVNDSADDNESGTGQDEAPADYKEVKVEVTWAGVKAGQGVKAVSKFVSSRLDDEAGVGGGSFRLNIMDGSGTGAGIQGVASHIENSSVNPAVDINTYTDSYGTILLVGMPAGDRNYQITVSKDGYESVTTLPPYPITSFDPTDVHASVMEGDLNTKTIIIDRLSNIHFSMRDILDYDHLFPDIHFNLKGGRVIGLEYGTTNEITNYDQNLSTGANGDVSVNGIPPGKYAFALEEPGYTLVGADPSLPINLAPNQSLEENLILASNSINSLIVTVKNSQSGLPVPNVSVRLYNDTGFDVTQLTGEMGQVYFPPNTDPPTVLSPGTYTLEASVENYQPYSEVISVSQLTQKEVALVPIAP